MSVIQYTQLTMPSYRGTFTVEATAFDSNGVVDIEMLNKQFEFIRNAIVNMEIEKEEWRN